MFVEHERFDQDQLVFDTDVAIVGMAGRFPGAPDIDAFWRNLREGVESIRTYSDAELLAAGVSPRLLADPDYVKAGGPLPDMEMFDPALFGLTPFEASVMDPQHRHFLECAWAALENAGHSVERFAGPIGVFAGSGHNAYLPYNLLTNPELVRSTGLFLLRHTGNDKDFLTTRVSYLLDLKGPSVAVQTACSTSLVAVHSAVQSLLAQECDMALAGAVTIELPHGQGYLREQGGILSADGHCRPFDSQSQGTVFTSACGVVVLRRLREAIDGGDHIYAVIKGSAINNDGSGKVGYLAPSVSGQSNAILEAQTIAGVAPDTIGYVEAHGSGTQVGDPIEVTALTEAFRQGTDQCGFCGLGSVKGNIGHTDTAAGIAALIKTSLSLHHRELPPSLNFEAPNEGCNLPHSPFYVNDTLKPWPQMGDTPRRAGVTSLGIGGTNAHLILEEAPPRRPGTPASGPYLLVLSAASEAALDANMQALGEHLAVHPALDLADVAHTLQVGRRALPHRRCLVAQDVADAAAVLAGSAPERIVSHVASGGEKSVAFLFAGGGAQHPRMGQDLYEAEPAYREAMDRCLAIMEEECGVDLRAVLYPEPGEEAAAAAALERPSIGLPALFAGQYAQAQLWRSWGIVPDGMIGHSMGEYVAAHLAGVFSLADALKIVHLRGRLFETLPPGAMLSVPMAAEELAPLIDASLSIGVVNGPKSTVVSGPVEAIEALQRQMEAMEMPTSRLRIAVAAHSAMLEPILPEFTAFLGTIAFHAPTRPFVSNLTGTWITAKQAQDPAYWTRHLRETVHFDTGLAQLLKDGSRILLEVGPGRTLASLARQHPGRAKGQPVFQSSRHPGEQVSDTAHMLEALGRLWAAGAPVLFGFLQPEGSRRLRVPLPTYRFDHQRYWIEPGRGAVASVEPPADPSEKRPDIADWFYRRAWRKTDALPPAEAGGRMLIFADEMGIAPLLETAARARGDDVILVSAGRRFARKGPDSFCINPRSAVDHDRLLSTLVSEGRVPAHIYHLWSVTDLGGYDHVLREADQVQALGFHSLLHLAQAIGQAEICSPIELVVVSNGMQRVGGEVEMVPAKATLLGPCRVIPRELPNVRARSVDIILPARASRRERALIEALLREAQARDGAETVALRAGERWVEAFEPARAALPNGPAAGLRQGGAYVVTGGLGEIGLTLARHLAETAGARLLLMDREELPPREAWLSILAGPGGGGCLGRRIRQLLAIEKASPELLVIAADVTDPGEVRRAIRQARLQFGPIHGVFHAAGVAGDAPLAGGEGAVLAPKVRGTLALQAALAGEQPDFLMLFSSVSGVLGPPGHAAQAAASAFLDAFAQASAESDDETVIAVDWSRWASARAMSGADGAPPPELGGTRVDHPLIDRCLRDEPDERLTVTRFATARHWLLDEHRTAGGSALMPGTGFLAIADAAAATIRPAAGATQYEDLLFLEPFHVADGAERDLFAQLRRAGDGAWAFELSSNAPGGAAEGATVVHARGTLRFVVAAEPERLPAAAIRARCARREPDGRDGAPAGPMRLGARWKSVARIDYGEEEALIELALPPAAAGDLPALSIHPALLDRATAGAQALMPGFDPGTDLFVPASYERIRLHRPLSGALLAHVRYRAEGSGPDVALFDVTIADTRGLVLAEVREFTMVRLRDPATLEQPDLPPPPEAERPASSAILPQEGLAVIERILGLGLGPQIVVSPGDFGALLARARAPLASPPLTRAQAGAEAEHSAVMTPTERMIASLWEEMLGVEQVAADDNFFDLGGHSLLAVQFVNKLRKRTGRRLAATLLVEAPTVAQLAARVGPIGGEPAPAAADPAASAPLPGDGPRSGEAAILIREGGHGIPLFLVHDGMGEILLYRTLAMKLDPGRPVYGLVPTTRADGSIVETEISGMAAAHLAKVRQVQPHGPYLLAGMCAGGVIAFEMARQLEDAGEEVLFVGIIDAADVAARERPFFVSRLRLKRFARALVPGAAGQERASGSTVGELAGKVGRFVSYEGRRGIETLRNRRTVQALRRREADEPAEALAAPPPSNEPLSFLDIYNIAHREHRPRGVLSRAELVLYRATQDSGEPGDMPYAEQYSDVALGWGQRVAEGLQVVAIPGGHTSSLQEPHVGQLARAMQDAISGAIARAEERKRLRGSARSEADARAEPPLAEALS